MDYLIIYKLIKYRKNLYIENYNKRIRDKLGPFFSKIGIYAISWQIHLSYIINEENEYKNNLICLDNNDFKKS